MSLHMIKPEKSLLDQFLHGSSVMQLTLVLEDMGVFGVLMDDKAKANAVEDILRSQILELNPTRYETAD